MRICISGAPLTGKQDFVSDFIKEWPNYSIKKTRTNNKSFTAKGLIKHLNTTIDSLQEFSKEDNIILNSSPIDCLVYALWSHERGKAGFDREYIAKLIPLVKESMRFIDIIFFTPISLTSPIEGEEESVEREELDNIYKAIVKKYHTHLDADVFFPKEDCPCIIDIFGNREQRILLVKQYLADDGNLIGEEEDSILNPDSLTEMEQLLQNQLNIHDSEQRSVREEAMRKVVSAYSKKLKL